VQSLWSGYGRIQKVDLRFEEPDRSQSAIVKFVDAGDAGEDHPRGWNGGGNLASQSYWEPTYTHRHLSSIG